MKRLILLSSVFMFLLLSSSCSRGYRYEMAATDSGVFIVDKKTGTVWGNTSGEWINAGTPPKDAPKKGDRSSFRKVE